MASVFTKIVQGELPSYKLYEDEEILSFLTLEPINLGHALVIPKKEVDHFFDVEEELTQKMSLVQKHMAKAIKAVTGCVRVGVAVQGFEVPHAHVHLIPLWEPKEFSFSNGRRRSEQDMLQMQEKLLAEIKKQGRLL